MKQFNTLSKTIAQALRYGNEVCFRASYLASSLGAEVDEICHFSSKNGEKRSRTEGWTMVSSFVVDALKPTGNGPPSQPQMDDSEETWNQPHTFHKVPRVVVQLPVKNEHVPR